MRHFRLTASLFMLAGLLVCTAVWAQPAQQPRTVDGQITVDQVRDTSAANDEVSRFESWLRSVDPVSADILFGEPIRTTSAGDVYCEGAIDIGGIFCALACECECNFGTYASQCCCQI